MPHAQGTRCAPSGQAVDSAYTIDVARRLLDEPRMVLEPVSIQIIRGQGIEEGLVISMVVVVPPTTVKGGGLVWVDIETGCGIVLRRYE